MLDGVMNFKIFYAFFLNDGILLLDVIKYPMECKCTMFCRDVLSRFHLFVLYFKQLLNFVKNISHMMKTFV